MLTHLPSAPLLNTQLAVVELGAISNKAFTPMNFGEQSSIKTYSVDESTYSGIIDQLMENWNRDLYEPSTTNLGKAFDWIMGWSLDENGNKNPSAFGRVSNLFTKAFNLESTTNKEEKEDLKSPENKKGISSIETNSPMYELDPNFTSYIPGKVETSHTQSQPIIVYNEGSLKSASGFYDVAYNDTLCSLSYTKQNWTLDLSSNFSNDLNDYPDLVLKYSQCLVYNVILPYFRNQNSTICHSLKNIHSLNYPIPNGTVFRIFTEEGVTINELNKSLNETILNLCYEMYSLEKEIEIETEELKKSQITAITREIIFLSAILCTGTIIYCMKNRIVNQNSDFNELI